MSVYNYNDNLVVPEFLGRLGNNLFQVAACIGYAKDNNVKWYILPNYHHRPVYNYFQFPIWKGNPRKLHVYDTATDQGFPYAKIPFHPAPGVKIRGFWQSWKYFDHAKDEVLKAWNLKDFPHYHEFASVHVRRTDYLQHADNFGAVDLNYIEQAMNMAMERGFKKFVVFSDDIPWCKSAFQMFNKYGLHIEYSENTNEYIDLSMMSSCSLNIIANSSFSWIAAYANQRPDKVVISPDHTSWFGPAAKLNTKDLLPDSWIKIKWR